MGRDGVWYARPYLGRDACGRAIRPYRKFPQASTREEAQALADTWAAHLTADGRARSARLTDLLADYADMRARNGASPNSVRSWRAFTRNYVGRYLGGALAADLTAADMGRFEQRLLTPKGEGGAGLSRNSVLAVHNFLRGAYNHLVAAGVVGSNPMVCAAHPSPERHEAAVVDEWDFPELDSRLEELMAAGDPARAAVAFAAWLALRTGLRVGEACALRRRDAVRSGCYLHVGGTVVEEPGRAPWRRDATKGRKCRNVSLAPEDMGAVLAFARFVDDRLGRRLPADAPLVTADGSIMRPTAVSAGFSAIRRSLGLPPRLTFHGLRHTHATWCLANGVDLKTLSERLGHADEATTLRIYAHVIEGRDQAAARAFRDAARAAKGAVPTECQRGLPPCGRGGGERRGGEGDPDPAGEAPRR